MDAQQNAKVQMGSAVVAVCEGHVDDWGTNEPFAEPYDRFRTKTDNIITALARQSTLSLGTTMDKQDAREELEAPVVRVADALVLHGKRNNKKGMAEDCRTSAAKLSAMREKDLVAFTKKLLIHADSVADADLLALGITPAMITAIGTKMEAFTTLSGAPRHMIAEAVSGTQDLDVLIEEMMEILEEEMDPAMEVLKYTHPALASEYKTAREIIDPGYNTRALTVNISANGSGESIAGVEARIMPGNIEKLTGPGGSFYINNLAAGTYTMILTSNSFATKTEEFSIANNQSTVVEVTMVPKG